MNAPENDAYLFVLAVVNDLERVSASRLENDRRRFGALTFSRISNLFEEHGASHGPRSGFVFFTYASEQLLRLSGPRLLAPLLQGDEVFHR